VSTTTASPYPRVPLWLLALITFSGTLAMHIFVPALPQAAVDLGASQAAMQSTVSLYILGLAVGQLAYGPLSDRFGRRPVLMAGLVVYTISGLAAALAPLVGSALAASVGWRSIFFVLCGLGVMNFLFAWKMLPETGQPGPARAGSASLAQNYLKLIRSRAFLGYSIGGGCATTSMYAFIASAPFIFTQQLHRPAHEVGIYLALLISGVWLGSMLASRLVSRMPIETMLVRANWISVLAAFVLLAVTLAGQLNVPLAVGCMFLFTLGAGTAAPAALTQAISVNPQVIGSASGLYGFTQMATGAICTAHAGVGRDPALAAAIILAVSGVIAQGSFWLAGRHRAAS
jgi:DHA1 family bicyclomycin/chloramphenicol resistance-like MFS transporter